MSNPVPHAEKSWSFGLEDWWPELPYNWHATVLPAQHCTNINWLVMDTSWDPLILTCIHQRRSIPSTTSGAISWTEEVKMNIFRFIVPLFQRHCFNKDVPNVLDGFSWCQRDPNHKQTEVNLGNSPFWLLVSSQAHKGTTSLLLHCAKHNGAGAFAAVYRLQPSLPGCQTSTLYCNRWPRHRPVRCARYARCVTRYVIIYQKLSWWRKKEVSLHHYFRYCHAGAIKAPWNGFDFILLAQVCCRFAN